MSKPVWDRRKSVARLGWLADVGDPLPAGPGMGLFHRLIDSVRTISNCQPSGQPIGLYSFSRWSALHAAHPKLIA